LAKEDAKAADGGAATQNCYTKKSDAGAGDDPLKDYKPDDKGTVCKKATLAREDITEKEDNKEAKNLKACAKACNELADEACKGFEFDD
jgi:hypothetical protein